MTFVRIISPDRSGGENDMNNPKMKLAGGIGLLIALGILYFVLLLFINTVVNGSYNLDTEAARMKAINSSVGSIKDLNDYVETREVEKFENRVSLWALAAGELVHGTWDGKSTDYGDGTIVTVSGDRIEYPKGYPEEQKIDAASLQDEYGIVIFDAVKGSNADAGDAVKDSNTDAGDAVKDVTADTMDAVKGVTADVPDDVRVVGYCRLDNNIYYIESELLSVLMWNIRNNYDVHNSLKESEEAFDIRMLIVSEPADQEGDCTLLYKSDALPENINTLESLGITKTMLEEAPDINRSVTGSTLMNSLGSVTLGDESYRIFIQKTSASKLYNGNMYLVYLIPEGQFFSMTVEQTVVMLAVFIVIGILLLVWYFSTIRIVRRHRLNEEQKVQLGVKKTVKQAFSMIIVGCIVLLIVAALFISLFRLFGTCNNVKKYLKVLEQRIEENEAQKKVTAEELKNTYVSYAERIAGILKEKPECATKDTLQKLSDLLGADYIMIYDNDGKEVLSNSRYVGMEFGDTPESSTYEFRRLLKGIPSVVHDAVTDKETGLTNAMVGVSLESSSEPGKYGALLIALPEYAFKPVIIETLDDVMKSLVADGTLSFSLNPEDQMVVNASNDVMIGRNAKALEMPEAAVSDSYRDFFTLNDVICYGESKDIDGFLYYYAAEQSHIYKNVFLYSGIAALVGFILLAALIGFLMFGYRKGFEQWAEVGDVLPEKTDDRKTTEDESDQVEDPRKRWKLSLSKFGLRTPLHNAGVALEITLVVLIIGVGVWYYFNGSDFSGSLIGFVLHGQWTKGLNLFSFTSILILFAQVTIVISILKIVLRVVTSPMGPNGETFRRLGLNLLTYAGMIFFIYMALYNLGVNIGALVASLSLPACALSLGAKDLITDVLAGVSLVFDGEFKVGDYVEIGGFCGDVMEIGVRTTKLLGIGGKIKIIANRDIKNIINMSRRISEFVLKVKISTIHNDLREVEEMLKEELPKYHDKVPGIIEGPLYWGVDERGFNFATFSIAAKYDQKDYIKVKGGMKIAVQDLFDKKGIPIKF